MVRSIMQDDMTRCYLCGRQATEVHHVLGGVANRPLSTKYGLVVALCHECHLSADGAQYNPVKNFQLKAEAQAAFEAIYGHDAWMNMFYKNYIY